MTKNIAYQTSKVLAEETLRWAGRNPEYSVPLGLAIADPRTRNFALRTTWAFAKETGRFKFRMLKATGSNVLKGGKPLGWTAKSGTGYVGRGIAKTKLIARAANPLVLATATLAEVVALQVALAPETTANVYQTHMSGQPSVGSGGSKLIFGSW